MWSLVGFVVLGVLFIVFGTVIEFVDCISLYIKSTVMCIDLKVCQTC